MLSGIVTTMMLLLFIAMWIWAWQPRLRNEFAAAARLAVDDGVPPGEEMTTDEGASQ
ncbi:MAG: cbb3-type cytochrome c oxidase subunit 3 [Proteobacteria bacterium]|nr:cbb3-type cytochrome c oxidase subunit 3 [Pseudomonadota bacterium]